MEHARHVFRVVLLVIAVLAVVSIGRTLLLPRSYGMYGPYRYDNVAEQMKIREPVHAGPAACGECHEKEFKRRASGKHKNVSCEVCHAPKAFHIRSDGSVEPWTALVIEVGADDAWYVPEEERRVIADLLQARQRGQDQPAPPDSAGAPSSCRKRVSSSHPGLRLLWH